MGKSNDKYKNNIFCWYQFRKNSNVLFMGKDCECVSYLESIGLSVDVVKKMNDSVQGRYEYIICYGGLNGLNVVQCSETLERAKRLLADNGIILLLVNNVVNPKYVAEYSGDEFKLDGISKKTLEKSMKKVGLFSYKFYYPMPSYEAVSVIYTDEYLPTVYNYDRSIEFDSDVIYKKFNHANLERELIRNENQDFPTYCNSYFVEAKIQGQCGMEKAVFFNNIRKPEYRLVTKMYTDKVIKIPERENDIFHVKEIERNIQVLKALGIQVLDNVIDNRVESSIVTNNPSLDILIADAIGREDYVTVQNLLDSYRTELLYKLGDIESQETVFSKYNVSISAQQLSELNFVKHGLYDLIFSNIFIVDGVFYVYDQEWYEENVPVEFITYRAIKYLNGISDVQRWELYGIAGITAYVNIFQELENLMQCNTRDEEAFNDYVNSLKSLERIKDYEAYLEKAERENLFRQELLDSRVLMYASARNQIEQMASQTQYLNNRIIELQNCLEEKMGELSCLQNSSAYRYGSKMLRIVKRFRPVYATFKMIMRILKKIYCGMKCIVSVLIRGLFGPFYKCCLPRRAKRRIRQIVLSKNKLAHMVKQTSYYDYTCSPNIDILRHEDGTEEQIIRNQVQLNKSIGIHLHLYYTDLLDEFYQYLLNIPYKFDLYVSVMEDADTKTIYKKLIKILNVEELKVEHVPNSGRDFGAMFVAFKDDLRQHDYVMHIHSKKSLRMGDEQAGWRRYMLNNLLGNTERIMKNFYLMENLGVGMVYTDNYRAGCPYWGNTWLNEAPTARRVLGMLGMEFKDEILQFPAGSMFWAKEEALDALFGLSLTWDDFGYEEGKNDGTLAYVFERITAKVARESGYKLAIFNVDQNVYLENKGEQLFHMYADINLDAMYQCMKNYEIVTFDIFDTLVTRKIYEPDDSFYIVESRIKKKGLNIENYLEKRKQAEEKVRKEKNFQGDCDIDEIYQKFQILTGITKEQAEMVKHIEVETEYELVIPRYDMLALYNRLLKDNKKIILISDMYLTKEMIANILKKCGYENWYDLMVSSDLGVRKDTGAMWTYFFERYGEKKTIHCGDNETSDIHKLAVLGKDNLYVMRGVKLNTLMKTRYVMDDEKLNPLESVVIGMVMNRIIVNSPFALNQMRDSSLISNFYDLGYAVIAPVLFYYMIWLIRNTDEKKEQLLFAAREGYYLQKVFHIFQKYIEKAGCIQEHYLYISRRAITVANIKNRDDIEEIMSTPYIGTLRELLYYRLGFWTPGLSDAVVELPREKEMVMNVVDEHLDEIVFNAKQEREAYLKYMRLIDMQNDAKQMTVVDLGYAGTAQYYLAKLTEKKINGKYFAVQKNLKPLQLGCDVFSCFNKELNKGDVNNNLIYKCSLFLEAFLTSPDGQFQYFEDKNGKLEPQFLHEARKEEQMKNLDQVYEGVKDYVTSILELFGEDIFNYDIDRKYIFRCYENCIFESPKFNEKMRKLFCVEDFYCSNTILDTFDIVKYCNDWNYE